VTIVQEPARSPITSTSTDRSELRFGFRKKHYRTQCQLIMLNRKSRQNGDAIPDRSLDSDWNAKDMAPAPPRLWFWMSYAVAGRKRAVISPGRTIRIGCAVSISSNDSLFATTAKTANDSRKYAKNSPMRFPSAMRHW